MGNQIKIGAAAALLAVAIGAFGAHGLESRLSDHEMEVFRTGVQYHFYHALGILLIAAIGDKLQSRKLAQWASRLLLAGIVLFSGSLYVLALSGVKVLGAVTPLGGLAFIAGWLCLFLSARKG
jgi:uncharacterized membrane protein YgdD (TMEM256/DUF423 family)